MAEPAPHLFDETGVAMRLSPLVQRVLAPNPSPFTYHGTQSYVIGTSDLAVIDPGPAEEAHLAALVEAIGGRPVAAILCTHTHRDHSPAARLLADRTGAPIVGCAPLALRDDGPRADAAFDADYAPDQVLLDGEQVMGQDWTLTALATPGHTSNHLCFALEEEGALFSGDHVMGWSTSVVSPPDGDMTDYLASLERLIGRADSIYYPAHGDPIPEPRRFVRHMLGHRRMREGQILRLLDRNGALAIDDMVTAMYVGLDPRLIGAAGRSVLAHLIDLEGRGLVQRVGESWERTH
ncbi:MAG: MBL fold metallo-hydrolase [Sphingomonadales bacterium]|nr:MBL fold metallo-hydrolase [Sphingomonadales bacterium]